MNEENNRPKTSSFRVFFGGALVLLGGLKLLSDLHMLGGLGLRELWPTLFVWLGVSKLVVGPFGRALSSGVFWILVGGFALVHTLGFLHFRLDLLWPVLVILIGVKIMLRQGRSREYGRKSPHTITSRSGPKLNTQLMMTGARESFDGRPFDGGSIRCVMAGYELDLRGAEMVGDECEILVEAHLGGIEIRVPRSWRVENEATAMLGAVENQTTWVDVGSQKRLFIRGNVVLSGVEIRN